MLSIDNKALHTYHNWGKINSISINYTTVMYIVNKPTYHINRNCKTISHAFKMGVTECSVTTTKFT